MDPLAQCFVDNVRNSVRILDIFPGGPHQDERHQFSTLDELSTYMLNASNQNFSSRFISICQRTSWGKLQVTRPMLELIASKHGIVGSSFWDLPSLFYTRNKDVEEAFCVPFTQNTHRPWTEISYSIRYPEFKPRSEEYPESWAIRQTAVYHSFNVETRQTIFILFNPTPDSKGHRLVAEYLLSPRHGLEDSPYHLHEILLSAYIPAWRQYMASQEREALQIIDKTFAACINEPLNLENDHLSLIVNFENAFLKIITLVGSTQDLLNDFIYFLDAHNSTNKTATSNLTRQFQNHRRRCTAYVSTARHLKDRAQTTAQLLADTLSFRDQLIAKQQNSNMLQLNKSAVFITILTLIYVPAAFSATFFGMNFFAMDEEHSRIVGTPMVWIFIISTIFLTLLTFVFYYWLMQHDGIPFPRLAPKVSLRPGIEGLARRWTRQNTGLQQGLPK